MSYIKFVKEVCGESLVTKKLTHIHETTSYKSLKKLPDDFKTNKEFILSIIKRISCGPDLYKYLHKSLQSDLDIFREYYYKIGTNITYIPKQLKNNPDVVAIVLFHIESPITIEWVGNYLICTPKGIRRNKHASHRGRIKNYNY